MKRLVSIAFIAVLQHTLWAGPQVPIGASQTAPPPKASISGVVVRAGTGEPIPRAQVTLTRVAGPVTGPAAPALNSANTGARGAAPPPQQPPTPAEQALQAQGIPAATTDNQGKFQLKDIEPGSYRVVAARNGFTKQEYGQRSFNRPGTVLNVRVGQQVQDITFRLTPAATISGRVVDGVTGEPLAGITVQASRSTYDASGKRTLQSAASDRTNDLGEYRLYWINPGHYYVSANGARSGLEAITAAASRTVSLTSDPAEAQAAAQAASIFGPSRTANEIVDAGFLFTYYPGTPDMTRAAAIELQPGAEMRADFNLVRGERFRIHGRVVDAGAGRPPQGVALSVSPRNAAGGSPIDALFGGLSGLIQGNTKYNAVTGEFEVRDVAAGSYWLQAMIMQPSTSPAVATAPAASANPNPAFLPSTTQIPVDVFGADLENVTLVVSPGIAIPGRVRIDGQTNPNQNPLTLITLSFQSTTGGSSIFSVLGNVRPATDGTFSIPRVGPGEYKLVISGLRPGMHVKEARLDQTDVLQGITISDRVDGSLEIVLSSNAGQVDGTVVGADLKPASGVQVVLIPDRLRNRQDLYKTATTNQDGRFTILGIAPGDYRLFAWEDIEPFAYFDPDVSRQYEALAKPVRIQESSRETVEVKIIPVGQ